MATSSFPFIFIILFFASAFLLTASTAARYQQNSTHGPFSAATAANPAPEQQQQNNSTGQGPFSAATAANPAPDEASSSSARAPVITCAHETSRNFVRRCMGWIVTVGRPASKPSGVCCDAVRKARLVPCLCSYITRDMEDLVSVEKLIHVYNSCGKKVRPGTKCAGYTVPRG